MPCESRHVLEKAVVEINETPFSPPCKTFLWLTALHCSVCVCAYRWNCTTRSLNVTWLIWTSRCKSLFFFSLVPQKKRSAGAHPTHLNRVVFENLFSTDAWLLLSFVTHIAVSPAAPMECLYCLLKCRCYVLNGLSGQARLVHPISYFHSELNEDIWYQNYAGEFHTYWMVVWYICIARIGKFLPILCAALSWITYNYRYTYTLRSQWVRRHFVMIRIELPPVTFERKKSPKLWASERNWNFSRYRAQKASLNLRMQWNEWNSFDEGLGNTKQLLCWFVMLPCSPRISIWENPRHLQ